MSWSIANSAEVHDPVNDSWSQAANMVERRLCHVSVLLQSGQVLVMGGQRPTPAILYLSAVGAMVGTLPDQMSSDGFELSPVMQGNLREAFTVVPVMQPLAH